MKTSTLIDVDPYSRMMKFAEKMNPSLKGRNTFNFTIKQFDSNSMASIRNELLAAIDVFFDIAHTIFSNVKEIIYIVSLLLMIYETYRYNWG